MARNSDVEHSIELRAPTNRDSGTPSKATFSNDAYELARVGKKEVLKAGGQYHWVSILAPRSARKFLSHVTGMCATPCAEYANRAPTAAIYLAASVLQSTIAMNIPSYDPKGWHITLIMWAILLICTVLNTWLGMILPVIEVLILLVHVLGFFAVLVPLVYLGPKADPRSIFTVSFDYGGWGDLTLATFIGLKGTVAAFVGKADFASN
ncbi:choline transport protein [Aspergillus luchuensis]|uniref:Choline transport protein n=1 Tax=Aspergillus kawachii TaxID=1069201 RepID=A0A146F542_ASPKA|nr:choline transport protein [Aspergillus luchuensis]